MFELISDLINLQTKLTNVLSKFTAICLSFSISFLFFLSFLSFSFETGSYYAALTVLELTT